MYPHYQLTGFIRFPTIPESTTRLPTEQREPAPRVEGFTGIKRRESVGPYAYVYLIQSPLLTVYRTANRVNTVNRRAGSDGDDRPPRAPGN